MQYLYSNFRAGVIRLCIFAFWGAPCILKTLLFMWFWPHALEMAARVCPGAARALKIAARAHLWAARALKMTAQAWLGSRLSARNGRSGLLRWRQGARNGCRGLSKWHKCVQNSCSGLLERHLNARNGCSKSLFKKTARCCTVLCNPPALLPFTRAWICTGSH